MASEEKAADGTMACVRYDNVLVQRDDQPDDWSGISLGRIPIPEVGDKDLLLAVKTSSVNPLDYKTATQQSVAEQFGVEYPMVMGVDVAGVVERVGPGVTQFKVGDEVWGFPFPQKGYKGAWAEKCVIGEHLCQPKPASLSWAQCGALPCVAVVSMVAVKSSGFKKGDTVLVRGATGGTGLFLLQLLHHLGAAGITAVCSGKNEGLAKQYGATEVIDYKKGDPATQLAEGGVRFDQYFDFAPDGTGGIEFYKKVPGFLKRGAQSTFIAQWGLEQHLIDGYPARTISSEARKDILEALTEVLTTKPFKIEVMETFALKDWEQALRICRGKRARGKVVLQVAP